MEIIVPDQQGAATTTFSGTAQATTGFKPGPGAVLVWTTVDAYVKVGEGVTSTTGDTPIPSYTPILLAVPKGTGAPWRVSAVRIGSVSGDVYAKPVTGGQS